MDEEDRRRSTQHAQQEEMQQQDMQQAVDLLVDFWGSNGDHERFEDDEQDEVFADDDLDEVDVLEFDADNNLVSTRQAASSDEHEHEPEKDEAEEDEGEAAGRPGNSQGHGPPKNPSASTEIVRSEAHGVQTLATQAAMERFVQPGLSAEGRQRVVAIAAAMMMASGVEQLDGKTVAKAVQDSLITEEQMMKYCADAGVPPGAEINKLTFNSVMSLATMLGALRQIGKVTADEKMEGDALEMYRAYEFVDLGYWQRLLGTSCGVGRTKASTICLNVFPTLATLYEALGVLGYTPNARGNRNIKKGEGTWKRLQSSQKKLSALSHKKIVLDRSKRSNNVGRLTSKRSGTAENMGKGKQGVARGPYKKRPNDMVSEDTKKQRLVTEERRKQAEGSKEAVEIKMPDETPAQKKRKTDTRMMREALRKEDVPRAAYADNNGNAVQECIIRKNQPVKLEGDAMEVEGEDGN